MFVSRLVVRIIDGMIERNLNRLTAMVFLSVAAVGGLRALAGDTLDEQIEQSAKLAHSMVDAEHQRGMIALDKTAEELEDMPPEKAPADEARRQFLLGKTEFYLDQQDEAGKYLNKAIELAPTNAEYHFFRAQAWAMNSDASAAEIEFTTATKLAPKVARYWYGLGLCEAGGGNNDEAMAAFRKAVEVDPKHARATLMIGAMFTKQGKTDEALRMFQKAAEIDPTYALAFANIGQIYQNRGKFADSLAAQRSVLKLDPDDARALAKAIQCEQAMGMLKERDADRTAIAKLHTVGKIEEGFYCRDQFAVGQTKLMAFEYFELEGDRPVRYSFEVLDDTGMNIKYKISLVSPGTDNKIAQELGEVAKDERVFFLDADYPNGEHKSFGSTKKVEPSYDETKARVIGIIEGKIDPASAFTPGK